MLKVLAVSRAVSGHFLVDAARHATLLTQLFPECFLDNGNDVEDESNASTLFKELRQLYEDLMSGESAWHKVSRNKAIIDFGEAIENQKLCTTYRTPKLWIQYCEYINIIKLYICAGRISD